MDNTKYTLTIGNHLIGVVSTEFTDGQCRPRPVGGL